MAKRKELTGKIFGKLTPQKVIGKNKYGHILWLCKCACGKEIAVTTGHLLGGDTTSCGCYKSESSKQRATTHGQKHTRLYNIWCAMVERCEVQTYKQYVNYGARGITVCHEWRNSFEAFYDWAQKTNYTNKLTLDRIDVNGNYEPSNCRWATMQQQQNNRRNNHRCEINGEILTLAEISRKYNINYGTLKSRISRGWSIERAIAN